jgi:Basic region leucine zipper
LPIAYPHTLQSRKLEKFTLQANLTAWRSRQIPRDEVEKLKDRIDELESENDALQDQIDSISDIISGEDEDDEGGRLTPACGSGWRKETSQVTDRRVRQRADECKPPGKTVLNYPSYFWAD